MSLKQFPLCLITALAVAGCTTPVAEISSSETLGPADADFITTSYQIVQLDDQEGTLAATKAADPRIKNLSSQLMAQANELNPELQTALKAEGAKPPTRLPADLTAKIQKLRSLSGPAFDRQFLADQIESHQRAVGVFQTESRVTKDAALRREVTTIMPVVEQNLAKLQYISDDLKHQG